MARNETIWCPSGGDWYGCSTGSFFAGCFAVDPCSDGCPKQNLYPVRFDEIFYGNFVDLSCGVAASFYTCGASGDRQAFWGCCKTNPCFEGSCPEGDLAPAFMETKEQVDLFGDSIINDIGLAPVTTSSVALAEEPAKTSAPVYNDFGPAQRDIVLPTISIAAIVAFSAFVALWLGWRKASSRGRHTYVSVDSLHSSIDAVDSTQFKNHVTLSDTLATPVKNVSALAPCSLITL